MSACHSELGARVTLDATTADLDTVPKLSEPDSA
jgi:hypothetical protein